MKNINANDVRNLFSRIKTANSFGSKLYLDDLARHVLDLIEMFETLLLRVEKTEALIKKVAELEADQKKLHQELDRVKVAHNALAQALKNAKKD